MKCDLSSCFLCQNSLPEWKNAIGPAKTTFAFRKGQSLFLEGEPSAGVFLLTSGAVKVHRSWGKERELLIRFARAGDLVGHRGFWGPGRYPVSATALADTVACFVDREFLEASLKTNPGLVYNLLKVYAAELQAAEWQMRNLALMDVRGRISDTLLTLRGTYGTELDGFLTVSPPRQDIAAHAGTIYETVFKTFQEFTREGTIEIDAKRIRIKDPAALERYRASPGPEAALGSSAVT